MGISLTKKLKKLMPGWQVIVFTFLLVACTQVSSESTPTGIKPTFDNVEAGVTETLQPTPEAVLEPTETLIPQPTLLPYTSPEWFTQARIYEIFVRSFADSNGDGIGDLQGIISKLDYIQSLGLNTIWLMPIYPSPSSHGYDVMDYFSVNPKYGSIDDVQALVAEAHTRDMKIILDFVPSHLSYQNPIFLDAFGNPESIYSDWFVWRNDEHTTYVGFAENEEMPRFNHYNPEVVDYLTQAALFWLDLDADGDYTDGIDGFRVDNATFPPQEFLISFRQAVKSENPNAVLLGETWVNAPADLSRYFEDQFDALFDFPLYKLLQGDQNTNGDGLLAGKTFPILLTTLLNEEAQKFPPEGIPVRFINNHDTNRTASELAGDPDRMKLALALIASLPDPLMIYYGEEIGMLGEKGPAPYYDNYRREPMDWYAAEKGPNQTSWFKPADRWNQPDDGISVEEQDTDPASLLNFYRSVLTLRTEKPALTSGTSEIIDLQVDGPGPWAILRTSDDQSMLALYNFSSEIRQVTIESFPFSADAMLDWLTGENFPGVKAGESFSITLPPAKVIWLANR